MNKSFWIFLLFFMVAHLGYCQDTEPAVELENKRPSIMVHYQLLPHLIYKRPAINIGIETKLNKNWGVNVGLGYLQENLSIYGYAFDRVADYKVEDLNGYYIALEPKFYPFVNTKGKTNGTYFSVSLDMQDHDELREDRVSRFNGAYSQIMPFNRREQSFAQLINLGTTLASWKFVDMSFSMGIGHRFIKITNDLPADAARENPNNILRSNILDGNLSRLAIKMSLYLTFPSNKNSHIPN